MGRQKPFIISAIAVTWLMVVLTSALGARAFWGINHFIFLPPWTIILSAILAVVSIVWLLLGHGENTVSEPDSSQDQSLLGKPWQRALIALVCIPFFVLLRSQTHFLGDGYGWLQIFGNGAGYYLKWTEFGSSWFVRQLELLLGGFTNEHALIVFQTLSVISGAVVVYNVASIVALLFEPKRARIVALVTLLVSGSALLWFGYVEFYPAFWAMATTFVHFSVLRLRRGGYAAWVILTFILSAFTHLQTIYLFPGLAYVLVVPHVSIERIKQSRTPLMIAFSALAVTALVVFFVLWFTRLNFETIFLPLLKGRPASPHYAILSPKHLFDIFNLFLLLFPGLIVLVAAALTITKERVRDSTVLFLAVCSAGSLLFLLVIDPQIGMARD